jgi:hypothetical protein
LMLSFEYFDAAGAAVADGVFIPTSDLLGVEDTELEAGDADKESKVALALLNVLYETLSLVNFDSLGWAVSKGNPTSAGADLINQGYSVTNTYAVDFATASVGQLPVPSAGANADVGLFGLFDLFPNAAKVAAAGNTSGAGVLIPSADIAAYGAPVHASVTIGAGEDNRDYLAALVNYLAAELTLRTGVDASAVTNKSRGSATGLTPPADWTDATNPTTGLDSADLPKYSFFSVAYGFTFQLLLDQSTQTFDVNHVTT